MNKYGFVSKRITRFCNFEPQENWNLKKMQIISNEPPKSRKDKSDLSDFYDETGPDLAYLKFKISQTGFKVFSRKKSLKDEC